MSPALFSPTRFVSKKARQPVKTASRNQQFSREDSLLMSDDDYVREESIAGSDIFGQEDSRVLVPYGGTESGYNDSMYIGEEDEDYEEEDVAIDEDQLGPEVDSFARYVDLYRRKPGDDGRDCALGLIDGFLKDTEEHFHQARGRTSQYAGEDDEAILEIMTETAFYKMEYETWNLVSRLLPERGIEYTHTLRNVSEYESNEILRRQLLDESLTFRELNIIRDWLRVIAPDPEIPNEDDEDDEVMGSGHMYTLNALKQYKLDNMDPVEFAHKGPNARFEYPERGIPSKEDRTQFISTEMDPDGPIRQERTVAEGDNYYDTTFYKVLWGFIRKGDFRAAAEWCRKCDQAWRAPVVLGGRDAVDWVVDDEIADDEMYDASPQQGPSGNRRRQLWRRACYALAKRGSKRPGERWERAAYGLLAGDIDSAIPACESWHDHVHAQVNALIEAEYESFLQMEGRVSAKVLKLPAPNAVEALGPRNAVAKIVDSLSRPNDFRFSASPQNTALRAVQGAIISNRIPKLVKIFAFQLKEFRRDPAYEPEKDTNTPVDCTDWKLLRIVTHLIILLQHLGQWPENGPDADSAQEVIAGYIRMLAAAEKYGIIPLYASRLSRDRCVEVMGEVLMHVTDESTRDDIIRSFQSYELDTQATLKRTMENAFIQTEVFYKHDELPIQILSEFSLSWQDRRKVQPEDEKLIRTAEWMLHVDEMKEDLINAGVMIFKRFYLTGRLDAARALADRIPSGQIVPGDEEENEDLSDHSQKIASVYVEYEFLIEGLDALDEWSKLLASATTTKREGGLTAVRRVKLKDELQIAYENAESKLGLLVNSWLVQCQEHADAEQVKHIRNTYVPDITIALHNIHLAAGHNLNKSYYSKCLDLAVLVAKPSSGVAETFIATGRMAKYVDELANVSLMCLQAAKGASLEPTLVKPGQESKVSIWNVKTTPAQ
ncbi:Nucleoporin nup84 [Orbilia blumenaviensis]|uniref:Nuclear pore complex protein n=1 Tax=Orbilia blumenaviensis TaxID=1796055 RepID=A0AAV9V315_9PEZI